MKFYNISTYMTQYQIDKIVKKLSMTEMEYIQKIYSEIKIVEYTNDEGFECMFGILDSQDIDKLSKLYKLYNINFKIEDLSKKLILDYYFKTNYINCYNRNVEEDILELIKKFKLNWVTKDDILDKILEKGMSSLTEVDLEILNS
jgi:hypothetical protein